jgi:HEAT repeat protein/energy-coupling factor transporter ATP-binding protein EcfA2
LASTMEIFLSYAHKDRRLKDKLVEHLSLLKQQGRIAMWYDQDISAGIEWQQAIREHIDNAQVILLLISPAFMASENCYCVEMMRAIERHNMGEARVIPIILRPVDWHNTPFGKLQALPLNGQPITLSRNADKAFFDVAQGIRKTLEEISVTKTYVEEAVSSQSIITPTIMPSEGQSLALASSQNKEQEKLQNMRKRYYEKIFSEYRMLDFRGIMHVDLHRSISIPLVEVFIFPDVLVGVPEHETLEREGEGVLYLGRSQRTKRIPLEREMFLTVLAKYPRLVLLGDPGSGKSTLLRYLLLQIAQESDLLATIFSQGPEGTSIIPLYVPLATYAEVVSESAPGNRSLSDFLPTYLHDHYLDPYSNFIQSQIELGNVLFLFDGLDEIPDTTLRIKIVQHIEMFTHVYSKNRFVVTSRIVGYKDAPLSTQYQAYTLADFSEEQIKTFTQRWCPAYERWVNDIRESAYLENAATKEAEKLFDATQSRPGVKRLAVNPLLLTILSLIQRQGIDLPSHRIELFDLCAMTLIDTWVRAKGQSMRFSKTDLTRILRPLAFWMHHQLTVGAIPEEELQENIVEGLIKRTYSEHEAVKIAEQFLQTVRSNTGILVERGKERYGFLHLTFEEYFAALELEKHKDRNTFITSHMHDSRWREVILLTVGAIGILRSNEEAVTELVCEVIARAGSLYERVLHRDLLLASLCLADDVGLRPLSEDDIIRQAIYLYLTTESSGLFRECSTAVSGWRGIKVADKAAQLVYPLLQRWLNASTHQDLTPATLPLEKMLLEDLERKSIHYRQLITKFFFFDLTIILAHLKSLEGVDWANNMLALFSDTRLRDKARTIIDSCKDETSPVADFLRLALADPNMVVQKKVVNALGFLGNQESWLTDTLILALFDADPEMQEIAIHAIQQLEVREEHVVTALFDMLEGQQIREDGLDVLWYLDKERAATIDILLVALFDIDSLSIRLAATQVLSRLQEIDDHTIDLLLTTISSVDEQVKNVLLDLLCRITHNSELMRCKLHPAFVDDMLVQEIAISALGFIGNHRPDVSETLLKSYPEASSNLKIVIMRALGRLKVHQPQMIKMILVALDASSWIMRREAARTIAQLGEQPSHVIDALLNTLSDTDYDVRAEALQALSAIAPRDHRVIDALLLALLDPVPLVSRTAMRTICQVCKRYPQQIKGLLAVFIHTNSLNYIDRAMNSYQYKKYLDLMGRILNLLGDIGINQLDIIDTLCNIIIDKQSPIRYQAASVLGQLGKKDSFVVNKLLAILPDTKGRTRALIFSAFTSLDKPFDQLIAILLSALADPHPDVRANAARTLGHLGKGKQTVVDVLLRACNDPNEEVKISVVISLGRLGKKESSVIGLLVRFLADSSGRIRYLAAYALRELDDAQPEIIDALIQALFSNSNRGRLGASQALIKLCKGQSDVVDRLLLAMADPQTSVGIRANIAATISSLEDKRPQVLEALLTASFDRNYELRRCAIFGLGQLREKQPRIVERLIFALNDPSSNVRWAAVTALGELGDNSAIVAEALLRALADVSHLVREEAAYSLASLQSERERLLATIEKLLQQHEPIEFGSILYPDRLFDALQKAVE